MGRGKALNSTKVVRHYPDIFNTPQNLGEAKVMVSSGVKAPVWKFKPTLIPDMMTSEGIRNILENQLAISPEEFYEICKNEKKCISAFFLNLLRTLYTIPRAHIREITKLINKDARKHKMVFLARDTDLTRAEAQKAIYDNLEAFIDEIKNAQTQNLQNDNSKISTSLLAKIADKVPTGIPIEGLRRYLSAIEIYYVNKSLTLADDYLEAISLYHMGRIKSEEAAKRMFVGPESYKRKIRNQNSFLIKTIACKELFLPTWFYKVRLEPRKNVEFDSVRRVNLYKNATLTALDIRDLYKESVDTWGYARCAITGDRLFFDYWASQEIRSKTCNISIDRKTEDCQYARGDVQLTTRTANISKQRMTNKEFTSFCSKVTKHQKEIENRSKKPTVADQLDLWPLE